MTDRPITPPPEMVNEWVRKLEFLPDKQVFSEQVFSEVAQWGSDQELEACCEWFVRDWNDIETADKLRAARRPKPPSLKEQALALVNSNKPYLDDTSMDIIRKALEALPND